MTLISAISLLQNSVPKKERHWGQIQTQLTVSRLEEK
jgi:hypothetical protein